MIRNIEVKDSEEPTNIIEISKFEKEVKARLPKDYISFY